MANWLKEIFGDHAASFDIYRFRDLSMDIQGNT
jgi:hypothetical protein